MAENPLVVPVAELLRHPGSRQHVGTRTQLAEAARVADAELLEGEPVDVSLDLESLGDGSITVAGTLSSHWHGTCRRCLGPAEGDLRVDVRELYRRHAPPGDDAYDYDGERLDLRPMVREALTLDLPLAPLCREDCAGLCPTCGANRNEVDCGHDETPRDPRWAALDEVRERLGLDPGA